MQQMKKHMTITPKNSGELTDKILKIIYFRQNKRVIYVNKNKTSVLTFSYSFLVIFASAGNLLQTVDPDQDQQCGSGKSMTNLSSLNFCMLCNFSCFC